MLSLVHDLNILRISASTAGHGSGEVEIEIDYKGDPAEINFNPNFIKDVLQNIDEEFTRVADRKSVV